MKIRAAAAVLAACVWATSAPALADTGTLSIAATILSASNCKFRPGSGTLLDFGSIDPSSSVDQTGTVGLVIRCAGSAGTATFAITAGDGVNATGPAQRRMRHTVNATEFLGYTLSMAPSVTTLKNVDTNTAITGTVTPAQFQNAIAGAFTDSIIVTLSP